MSDTNERSVASAGSVEPVLYAVMQAESVLEYCRDEKEAAESAAYFTGNVVPLYRSPTLTDAEREALDTAEASLMRESTDLHTPLPVRHRLGSAAATLRGLLERLK